MTLWKQFTGWDIDSMPRSKGRRKRRSGDRPQASPQFQALAWRLLLSYMGAMAAILLISTIAIYQFVSHSLYQQLDQQIVVLADAAAHSLPAIASGELQTQVPRSIDNDGDLDLPWQQLRKDDQSIEWFDPQRQLMGRAGRFFPSHSPGTNFQTWQQDQVRTLTIPVYVENSKRELQGYVRVSESTEDEATQLARLLTGMAWGGLIAALLVGMSGWWLTRRSLQPIEQNFRQLKQFTADASHELRSPLTAIKTAIDVMQSHPERIHPTDTKKVAAIASATQQMSRLVEDLLLLARTGTVDSAKLLIPLDELLEDLVMALQGEAAARAIALEMNPLPEIQIQGDAAQLRRLFANLLENALQYTPAGGIITVAIAVDKGDRLVRIQITDTGIGIAPDQLPFVFDRFWRADQARSRRAGGAGLGLAIAQTIAQTHGGEITVSSQLGKGSCFQVELPHNQAIEPSLFPSSLPGMF